MLMSFTQLSAQPNQRAEKGNFEKFQLQILLKQLEIEESKQPAFETMYSAYSEELKQLRPKHRRGDEKPTDAQIEEQILESFKMAEKTTALKKEYYARFKTILTPAQILEMYNIERRVAERMNSEMENRTNRTDRQHGLRQAVQ